MDADVEAPAVHVHSRLEIDIVAGELAHILRGSPSRDLGNADPQRFGRLLHLHCNVGDFGGAGGRQVTSSAI